MARILSLLFLVLMFVLLIPTGLVLASQNAVPGDSTYSVKRKMEDVIVSVASLHPATLAYFRVDFSKRRLTESVALVDKGSDANDALAAESLNDLATQTRQAVEEIKKVEDVQRRRYLAEQAIIDFTARKAKIELIKTALANRSTTTRNVNVPPPTPLPQIVQATPKLVYIVVNNQTVVVTATPAPTTRPTIGPTVRPASPTPVPTASPGGSSPGTDAAIGAADGAGGAVDAGISDLQPDANGKSGIKGGGAQTGCQPGTWSAIACGNCKADGSGFNTCQSDVYVTKSTSDPAAYCACAVQCGALSFCRGVSYCLTHNYCTAGGLGADGPDRSPYGCPGKTDTVQCLDETQKEEQRRLGKIANVACYDAPDHVTGVVCASTKIGSCGACGPATLQKQEVDPGTSAPTTAPTAVPAAAPATVPCPSDTYAQCLSSPQNGVNATCYQNGTNQAKADACIPNCGACQ